MQNECALVMLATFHFSYLTITKVGKIMKKLSSVAISIALGVCAVTAVQAQRTFPFPPPDEPLGNSVFCGSGNDFVFLNSTTCSDTASLFDDSINGSGGNDELFGNAGNDTIFGGDGNDQMGGGSGNDFLSGGSGDDVIFGGPGIDTAIGGPGNDMIFGSESASGDLIFIGGGGLLDTDTVFVDVGDRVIGASAGDTVNTMISMTQLETLNGVNLFGGPEDNNYIIFDNNHVESALIQMQQASGVNLTTSQQNAFKESTISSTSLSTNQLSTESLAGIPGLGRFSKKGSGVTINDYHGNNRIIFANMNSTDVSLKESNGQVAIYGANGAMLLSMPTQAMENVSSIQFSNADMSAKELTQGLSLE